MTIVVSIIKESMQRNPSLARTVTRRHRDDPRRLLRLLRASLDHEDGDLAEFTFYSGGDHGALLYPSSAQPLSALRQLLDARPLSSAGASVLWAFILQVPAERHAVRLRCNGGVSVFFKIDIPVSGSVRLSRSLGLPSLGAVAVELSELTSQAPCGVAVEARACGDARIRLYWMASREVAHRVASLACRRLHLSGSQGDELVRIWQHFSLWPDRVVLNVSSDGSSPPALKLELPAVDVAKAAELAGASGAGWRAFRSALALRTAPRSDGRFPYVGVRWSGNGAPDLTFYVDARGAARRSEGSVLT